jgi:hypothetical protein
VNDEIFKYLIKNVGLDIFERNKAGETVMSLAHLTDNKKRIDLIDEV